MSKYAIGDVVHLKSGGPPMTVRDIDISGDGILCQNLTDAGELGSHIFPEIMLMPCHCCSPVCEVSEEETNGKEN